MNNRVTIQLIETNVGYLDVKTGTNFPLSFGVAEIKDLTERKGTFSKSITLAATKNNARLLNYYFDVNVVAGTFNVNRLQKCIILQDGIPIVENAVLQLVSIKKMQQTINQEQMVEYTVLVKEQSVDFFTKLGQKKLTDLTFAPQTHTYSAANVVASFAHNYVNQYKYVMPQATGNDALYYLNEWQPGIYALSYWNKIFSSNGYSYVWDELASDAVQFHKLIIPYNGDTTDLVQSQIAFQTVQATRASLIKTSVPLGGVGDLTYNPYALPGVTFDKVDTEVSDPSNSYNPTTGTHTNPIYMNPGSAVNYAMTFNYAINVVNNSGANAQIVAQTGSALQQASMKIFPRVSFHKNGNGTSMSGGMEYIIPNNFTGLSVNEGTVFSPGTTTLYSGTRSFSHPNPSNFAFGNTINYAFTAGTSQGNTQAEGKWRNGTTVAAALADVKVELVITNITLTITPTVNSVSYLSPIDLRNYIPKDIQQADFIKAFVQMYNLFIDIDPNEPNKLIIKTRDKYYDDGKLVDWTKKLNKNREQNLEWLASSQKKRFILSYKQDKDSPNTGYEAAVNEIYGQQDFTYDNEFIKDIDKKEIVFSPTPVTSTPFGAVVPMINGFAPKTNIRILYDGGTYPCAEWKISNDSSQTLTQTLTTYPYFGHFDKPTNPNFDINFGTCDFYYYDTFGNKTNNNLYNYHWRRTLNQLNKGQMLTAYFDLEAADIQKMELSDKIAIYNGQATTYYNINQIIDYNPTVPGPTKVELISVDNELEFVPFKSRPVIGVGVIDNVANPIKDVNTGRNVFGTVSATSGPVIVSAPNNNIGNSVKGSVIFGKDNSVYGDSGLVMGDENIANEKAIIMGDRSQVDSKSLVIGDDNIVPAGLKNVIIVGDDQTATQSDTLYAPNIVVNNINGVPATSIVSPDLATVLVNGNTTGGSHIVITSGDEIQSETNGSRLGITDTYSSLALDFSGLNSYYAVAPGQARSRAVGANTYTEVLLNQNGQLGITSRDFVSGDQSAINFTPTVIGLAVGTGGVLNVRDNELQIVFTPVTDNTNTKVLARNATTGNLEEVDISAITPAAQDLATTLSIGNITGGNDIVMTGGSSIFSPSANSTLYLDDTTFNITQYNSVLGSNAVMSFLNQSGTPTIRQTITDGAGTNSKSIYVQPTKISFLSLNGMMSGPIMELTHSTVTFNAIPATDNTNTKVLARNNVTGILEQVDVSAIAGATPDLATVLATGNTTGTNDIVITSGQVVRDATSTSKLALESTSAVLSFDNGTQNSILGLADTVVALALNDPAFIGSLSIDTTSLNLVYTDNGGPNASTLFMDQVSIVSNVSNGTDSGNMVLTPGGLDISTNGSGYDYILRQNSTGFSFIENIGGDTPLLVDTSGTTFNVGMNISYTPITNNSNKLLLSRNASTGDVEQVSIASIVAQSTHKYAATVNLAAGNNTITHSLGTADVTFQLYDSTGVSFLPEQVSNVTSTQCNIRVATAMSNVRVVIIG